MRSWMKYLVIVLIGVFAVGPVARKSHVAAMELTKLVPAAMTAAMPEAAPTSLPGFAPTMALYYDFGSLSANMPSMCGGCLTDNEGGMSCAFHCTAQIDGLPAQMLALARRKIGRPIYTPLQRLCCNWFTMPEPHPPRQLIFI